jgi:hypothetical protein
MRLEVPMRRATCVIAALLMLTCLLPAEAATFGRTTVGTNPSGGLRSDFKRGSKFKLTQAGTLKQLCVYLDGNGVRTGEAQDQDFRLVLYRDAGGAPDTRVAESLQDTGVAEGTWSPVWVCQETARIPLSPGDYWIVIHSGSATGGSTIIRYYFDGAANWYGNADAWVDGASFSFGTGAAGNGTISAYAVFAPPAELGSAGRTSIGAKQSAGLRTHFKRGSGFTLSEPARVTSLSVYLDGLGATSGFENVRALIYKDKNGVPDSLVNVGDPLVNTVEIRGGMAPRWITRHAQQQVDLSPGKYWLILHTEGSPVARYYFDGTGNWYGNKDNYLDGPSNPFGAGATGDGTISAFVSYRRGPFVTQTFGRTDIATKVSKPLSANFIRGGYFQIPGEDKWLTAMYAYLDGLGGASGSQKMKMGVNNGWDTVSAATEEVTIPAGMAPQWVRFRLSPPILLKDDPFLLGNNWYLLFLYTGETEGVARAYGGGPDNNWYGAQSFYPHGPQVFDMTLLPGTGTLSIYGELSVPAP